MQQANDSKVIKKNTEEAITLDSAQGSLARLTKTQRPNMEATNTVLDHRCLLLRGAPLWTDGKQRHQRFPINLKS